MNRLTGKLISCIILLLAFTITTNAQSTLKQVLIDPTTYTPSAIIYDATLRDWKTSQPFFRNGYVESNSDFTISGKPFDKPISYTEGKGLILESALFNLGVEFGNNFAMRAVEDCLHKQYPNHPRLITGLSWTERIAFGAIRTYMLSKDHYIQANRNIALSNQLGYQ